jgi:hypothetical protein
MGRTGLGGALELDDGQPADKADVAVGGGGAQAIRPQWSSVFGLSVQWPPLSMRLRHVPSWDWASFRNVRALPARPFTTPVDLGSRVATTSTLAMSSTQ